MARYHMLTLSTRSLLLFLSLCNIFLSIASYFVAFAHGTFSMYYSSMGVSNSQTIRAIIFFIIAVLSSTISIILSVLALSKSHAARKVASVLIFIPLLLQVVLFVSSLVAVTLFFTSSFYAGSDTQLFYILPLIGGGFMLFLFLFTIVYAISLLLSVRDASYGY